MLPSFYPATGIKTIVLSKALKDRNVMVRLILVRD